MKLNKNRTEEFLKSLDEKATGRTAFFYQAIIVSLVIHIFVLFVVQMLTQDNRLVKEKPILMPLAMDMIEEQALEPEDVPMGEETVSRSGELKNLIANELSQRTTDQRSYRGMTREQINEEVYNDLKNLEAEEFARLKEGRPEDYSVKQTQQKDKKDDKKENDYDWYKDKKNHTSYSGNVTASYDMGSRQNLRNPTPTYRCKTQGRVVLLVAINSMGNVTDVRIDQAKSTSDECLRTESEKYARQWKFDAPANAPKRYEGTITFTFSAQ